MSCHSEHQLVGTRGFSSCPGLLTVPLQRTTAHLRPADRLSFPPFQHMASLPPSSTRYWRFWLATSPPGSHEGLVLHLCGPQRDPHTGWTLLADATTPASVVLRAPLAHRRVGEMAQLVPAGTQALPALVLQDTLCWFARAAQRETPMPRAESLSLPRQSNVVLHNSQSSS